jgi:hypothetical protein
MPHPSGVGELKDMRGAIEDRAATRRESSGVSDSVYLFDALVAAVQAER